MLSRQKRATQTLEKIQRRYRHTEPRWQLPLIDLALAAAAFVLAYIVRYDLQILRPVNEVNRAPFEPYIIYLVIYLGLLFLSYQSGSLYKHVRGRPLAEEVYLLINGAMSSTLLLMAISFVAQPLVFSRLMMIYVAALTIVLLALARVIRRAIQANLRAQGIGVERVLVVGAADTGRAVLRTMIARKELGYYPVGYLDDDPNLGTVDLGRMKGLGDVKRLEQTIYEQNVDTVVITLPWDRRGDIMEMVELCQTMSVAVHVVPDVFQLNLRQVQVENLDGIPLLELGIHDLFPGINRLVKRIFDVTLITLAAPVWVPLLLGVALAIRLESPGAVFYRQRRVGENGREFSIIKFRSMIPNADALHAELVKQSGEDPRHPKIKNDPRITRVGSFIRRTSLDELPNIINVLRGEMSLVGPRPPMPDEVKLYQPWHRQRLSIMPGITGLWQVSGRSDVPFDEMCLLDIYYIENWSIKMDAQILMMTIPRVLLRRGAY
jgi:exopolysaccharide biosynthesis polyprenyl glycosylphosphotransferase